LPEQGFAVFETGRLVAIAPPAAIDDAGDTGLELLPVGGERRIGVAGFEIDGQRPLDQALGARGIGFGGSELFRRGVGGLVGHQKLEGSAAPEVALRLGRHFLRQGGGGCEQQEQEGDRVAHRHAFRVGEVRRF
jgi:hypothetical protein